MILRRRLPGLKLTTEATTSFMMGRGASHTGRSMTVRTCGLYGSENVGMSSEMWVRIPQAVNPRFPGEGSSALGQSGPKLRPKGVGDG